MATAFAETGGDSGPSNTNDNADAQTGGPDFEAEAAKMGWVPRDQFKGDPEKHIDAETFVKRGNELLPIVQSRLKAAEQRAEKAERLAKQAADYFTKAEAQAYERARAEVRAEMAAAVESGDVKAADAAADKLEALQRPATVADTDEGQRAEEFATWMTENRWYTNDAFRAFADAEADKLARGKKGFLDRADLDEIARRVKDRFGSAFPEEFGIAKARNPRNPVDAGGTAPPRRAGKTAADLPDGGAQMRRFIKSGIVKDEATYLKNFKWD